MSKTILAILALAWILSLAPLVYGQTTSTAGFTVSLELNGDRPVVCSLDGLRMKLVRVPGSAGFYEQLRQKLAWGTPLVREGRR